MTTRAARFPLLMLIGLAFLTAFSLAAAPPARPPGSSADAQMKGIFEPSPYPEDVQLLDVFFVNDREGWVAGGTTVMNGGILLHTSDGGDHWDVQLGDSKSSDRGLGNRWNSREYAFPVSARAFSLPRRDRGYSPLEAEVQKLASQVQTFAAAAPGSFTQDTGASAGQPAPPSSGGFTQDTGAPAGGGFVQDVGPIQTTVDMVSNEVPSFESKYRNLNLLLTGFDVATQLPAQVANLKASLQASPRNQRVERRSGAGEETT